MVKITEASPESRAAARMLAEGVGHTSELLELRRLIRLAEHATDDLTPGTPEYREASELGSNFLRMVRASLEGDEAEVARLYAKIQDSRREQ
jgi:hypothetical protein